MSWLHDVLRPEGPAFALLHRPDTDPDAVDLLTGDMITVPTLADLPVAPGRPTAGRSADLLALVPYRQLSERGYACVDDGTPLRAMRVRTHRTLPLGEVAAALPDLAAPLRDAHFDVSDADYADVVRRVVAEEIGAGRGANFVLKRSLLGTVDGWAQRPRQHALAVFGRLLTAETGAHWTFLVCAGDRVLLGASPERHVTLAGGTATMNPISGTLRYPAGSHDDPESAAATVLRFLADGKEVDELYMVLDEELKMMGRVCADGGQVVGPRIRPMARLAHTEYFIEGRTELDVRQLLRETMFAPTVTGSPLESACRIIARYEPRGRGYYAGALALIGRDADGTQWLDSAIGIRMADVDAGGGVRVDVGATLVRHSDPDAEAVETRVKADGLLAAFNGVSGPAPAPTGWRDPGLWRRPDIVRALHRRNDDLAAFWLRRPGERAGATPALAGRRALVVDCEDHFTAMLGSQLAALGLDVTIRRFDEAFAVHDHDLLVMGPGPGDPRATGDPKIDTVRRLLHGALERGTPLLAVCLSHQVLAGLLGLPIRPLPAPNQGAQREIEVLGRREHCGFYNTFAAYATADTLPAPVRGRTVHLDRDPGTGAVHAIRGERFRSVQFHAESVLTRRGVDLLGQIGAELLHGIPATRPLQVILSA